MFSHCAGEADMSNDTIATLKKEYAELVQKLA
ncbi:MAG: hypothetical protein ACI915_004966, partial [Gammaproteobacteria bacterium]